METKYAKAKFTDVLKYSFGGLGSVSYTHLDVYKRQLFFEYLVRTDGNPQVGLHMSVVGLALNVILDYLFVGVIRWGTFGAALGTVCSISASAVIGLHYFMKRSNIRFTKPKVNIHICLLSTSADFSCFH